jgi:arylsulfatase A-like enzyme
MGNSQLISRRDFLKLAMLLPAAYFTMPLLKAAQSGGPGDAKNIIVIVYDACSADNVSLYGYQRQTTPNLDRFARNALVYHRNYSAGTFTIPGTASLLTGLYPWSHRAFLLGAPITPKHQEHQLFEALSPSHSTMGYAQNPLADLFLYEAGRYLKKHIDSGSFNLQKTLLYNLPFFQNDAAIAYSSFEDNIVQRGLGYDGSMFFAPLFRLWALAQRKKIIDSHIDDNPRGVPDANKQLFVLDQLVDGAIETLRGLQEPALTYLHFFPPHEPYRPTQPFYQHFNDGWRPPKKPEHPLAQEKASYVASRNSRQFYDEYLASWDAETGRLFDYLKDSGLLERSYVIITSDHGEIFERGELGHFTPLMYDPIMHSPLIISTPGLSSGRRDIYTQTSGVDLLPTLAYLTGNPIPDWAEGQILPGLGGEENPDRGVYTVDAKRNTSFAPLTKMSIALTRNDHRLVYYRYPELEQFEFYDLANDPEELQDLYSAQPTLALQMKAELLDKLAEVNRPYSKS